MGGDLVWPGAPAPNHAVPGTTGLSGPTLSGALLSGYLRSCLARQVLSLGLRLSARHQSLSLSTTSWKVPTQNIRLQRAKVIF